jgi:hypothetical protein
LALGGIGPFVGSQATTVYACRPTRLSAVSSPPPMAQFDFVAAAQRWVTEGRAECTRHGWNGTIVQRTNLRSVSPGNDMATDLTITINLTAGDAIATVRMAGHTIQDGATVNGCQTYHRETFSADGTLPAHVEIAVSPALSSEEMADMPPGFELPPGHPGPTPRWIRHQLRCPTTGSGFASHRDAISVPATEERLPADRSGSAVDRPRLLPGQGDVLLCRPRRHDHEAARHRSESPGWY